LKKSEDNSDGELKTAILVPGWQEDGITINPPVIKSF
jgi:hypothetical protein